MQPLEKIKISLPAARVNAGMNLNEIRAAIHKMIDAISDKGLLEVIYTFIKYLR